jgi:hypothetical protein
VQGHTLDGYAEELRHLKLVNIVLEFGTYDGRRLLAALLGDHLAHHGTGCDSATSTRLRQDVAGFFYPEDRHWRGAVLKRSGQIVDQALKGLGVV